MFRWIVPIGLLVAGLNFVFSEKEVISKFPENIEISSATSTFSRYQVVFDTSNMATTTIATFRMENGEWIVVSPKRERSMNEPEEKEIKKEPPKNDYSEGLRKQFESQFNN